MLVRPSKRDICGKNNCQGHHIGNVSSYIERTLGLLPQQTTQADSRSLEDVPHGWHHLAKAWASNCKIGAEKLRGIYGCALVNDNGKAEKGSGALLKDGNSVSQTCSAACKRSNAQFVRVVRLVAGCCW